jgi:hypothetical protein
LQSRTISGPAEEAGGVELLNEIWNFVPTGSNWRYYLEGVVHHYRRRIAIIESLRLIEQMYDLQSPLEETIRETVERVFTKLAIQGSRAEKMLKDRAHGTTGSSLRHEETRKAAVGLPAAMFVKPISLPALIHVLEGKVNKGWSQKDFPDMRLVIAASVPQVGATASTFLFEARLNVNEMNAQLSPDIGANQVFCCLFVRHDAGICLRMEEREWVEKALLVRRSAFPFNFFLFPVGSRTTKIMQTILAQVRAAPRRPASKNLTEAQPYGRYRNGGS